MHWRPSIFFSALLLASLPGVSGCPRQAPPTPAQEVQASSLPHITVKPDRAMLFTHATSDGTFATVDKVDKVPKDRLGWVRVVDLSIKPEQRLDHELVYVADLRTLNKNGLFPYVVMSRDAFESAALGRVRQGVTDPPPSPPVVKGGSGSVILYSTSWCGACRSAREFMSNNHIPFVEKDIEKDQAAAQELLEKAKAAGVSMGGVPVLDVNGTLVQGFDAQRLLALLGDRTQKTPDKKATGTE